MKYLLFLLGGAGIACLYWMHFTGHDNETGGALAAAVVLTIAGLIVSIFLAFTENKL